MPLDLTRMQGTWDITALEIEGAAMPPHAFAGSKIVIAGDRFTTAGMGAEFGGELTGDDSVVPHTLDMTFTEGPHAGKSSLALFELDGDMWKLCLCLAGGTRPTAFETTAGSGHVLEVLKRSGRGSATDENGAIESAEAKRSAPIAETHGDCNDPDLDHMVGTWAMVSGVRNGEAMPDQFAAYGKRVSNRTELTVSFGPQVFVKTAYRIDSSISPKSIDYVPTGGDSVGGAQAGIYELDGDILRTFMSFDGGERPSEFTPQPGDGRMLAVWKRRR